LTRLFALTLALAIATSAQAGPLTPRPPQDGTAVAERAANGGCGPRYHRGVGGACVHNLDGAEVYRPDSHWTPCDYSLGPSIPDGCGD